MSEALSDRGLPCTVVSPEGILFSGEVAIAVIPAMDGEVGFLPRHADYVTALGAGEMRLTVLPERELKTWAVVSGFAQVKDGKLSVVAAELHKSDTIGAAEAALELEAAKAMASRTEAEAEARNRALARAKAIATVTVRRKKPT